MLQKTSELDILIPTYNRTTALAVTLVSLYFQEFPSFNIYISDQSESNSAMNCEEVKAIIRALQFKSHKVNFVKNLPRRGMAQQRQFLLELAKSHFVLYLDDDLILEPYVIKKLMEEISSEGCGLVGTGTIGLNYIDHIRDHEQHIEFWEGRVEPERVAPCSAEWQRHLVHNAANIYHVQKKFNITPDNSKKYKLAWASGCVLFDRIKLIDSGGFGFWDQIPIEHCGEDVAAQIMVMAKYGGCGIAPCGVYHQELKTTLPNRKYNVPEQFKLFE